jgi:hypothetical protein
MDLVRQEVFYFLFYFWIPCNLWTGCNLKESDEGPIQLVLVESSWANNTQQCISWKEMDAELDFVGLCRVVHFWWNLVINFWLGLENQFVHVDCRFLGLLYTRSQGQCSPQIKHSYWCKSWNQPQGLYTRSQGQCSTQIKHSYWCKSWNQPQGLCTRSQGWNTKKKLFNLPQVTNKCRTLWPCIGPKAEKMDTIKFGKPICNPWHQCSSIY